MRVGEALARERIARKVALQGGEDSYRILIGGDCVAALAEHLAHPRGTLVRPSGFAANRGVGAIAGFEKPIVEPQCGFEQVGLQPFGPRLAAQTLVADTGQEGVHRFAGGVEVGQRPRRFLLGQLLLDAGPVPVG